MEIFFNSSAEMDQLMVGEKNPRFTGHRAFLCLLVLTPYAYLPLSRIHSSIEHDT